MARKKASKKTTRTAPKGGLVKAKPQGSTAIVKAEDLPEVQQGFLVHQLPEGQVAEQIAELFRSPDLGEFNLLRIRVPTGGARSFTVDTLEGAETKTELNCVILANKIGRAWWAESFDETGGGSPPSCSSEDGHTGYGVLPEEVLKDRGWTPEMGQPGHEGYACKDCAFSQFGSHRSGRRGQDCRQFRALFVLLEDELVPAVIVAPPSSLKSVQNYFMKLTRAALGGTHRLVTKVTLKQNSGPPPYSELDFATVGKIEESLIPKNSEFAALVQKLRDIVLAKFLPGFTIDAKDFEPVDEEK